MEVDNIEILKEDEIAELFDDYEDRVEAIFTSTNGIGWWFHENLAELYS